TVLTGRLGGTGAVATGGATAGAGGQFGLVAIAVMVATTDGGKGGLSREVTGIVETTRGAVFASSMLIGSSSRETKSAVFLAPAGLELAAWDSAAFGMTSLGALLALMIGEVGSNEPPNVVR